jgi:hypothetical protein
MTEWIKKQADQIKAKEEAQRKERDWQLHKRRLIEEQWESAWRAIQMAVRRQVELFNAQFSDDTQKHIAMTDERDFGFTLQRDYEHVTRVVQPSATVSGMHLRIIRTERGAADRRFNEADYRFGATTDGEVGMSNNGGIYDPNKAAETILGHLFQ